MSHSRVRVKSTLMMNWNVLNSQFGTAQVGVSSSRLAFACVSTRETMSELTEMSPALCIHGVVINGLCVWLHIFGGWLASKPFAELTARAEFVALNCTFRNGLALDWNVFIGSRTSLLFQLSNCCRAECDIKQTRTTSWQRPNLNNFRL